VANHVAANQQELVVCIALLVFFANIALFRTATYVQSKTGRGLVWERSLTLFEMAESLDLVVIPSGARDLRRWMRLMLIQNGLLRKKPRLYRKK
jgi:hypothetical protein